MAINWDWILTSLIIVGLILTVWSKMTQQTIKELLTDIRDFLTDTRENATERGEDLIYNE